MFGGGYRASFTLKANYINHPLFNFKKMKNASEISKEVEISLIRSLFSAMPIIGQALNEVVFEMRGRVKQERLNKFTEIFAEYFMGKADFDINALKTEDFGDLLEACFCILCIWPLILFELHFLRQLLINRRNPLFLGHLYQNLLCP